MKARIAAVKAPLAALAVVLIGCGADPPPVTLDSVSGDFGLDVPSDADVGARDVAGSTDADTAIADAVPLDVGTDAGAADTALDLVDEVSDAEPSDTVIDAEPNGEFGAILGSCGELAAELGEADGSFFAATIDFADDPFDDPEDADRLTPGGLAVLEAGNAGGSSLYSEVFAFEVLARCEAADLLETERTITYRPDHDGSITDLILTIGGQRVGVSVTRAVGFPRDEAYTVERARELLSDKLSGVLESSAGVSDEDEWVKQILVVIAYAEGHVDSLRAAVGDIDPEVAADTIVYVVESRGEDEWLY